MLMGISKTFLQMLPKAGIAISGSSEVVERCWASGVQIGDEVQAFSTEAALSPAAQISKWWLLLRNSRALIIERTIQELLIICCRNM